MFVEVPTVLREQSRVSSSNDQSTGSTPVDIEPHVVPRHILLC